MSGNIIIAFISRVAGSLLNFVVIVLTSKLLGAEARGNISLILLAITISQVIHQLIGGNPLVYFARKTALSNLLIPSYAWAIITSFLTTYMLNVARQIPSGYLTDVFILSVIQSLLSTHTTILLAYEKIKAQNFITLIQAVVTVSWLVIQFYLFNEKNLEEYVNALYLAYGISFLISGILIYRAQVLINNTYNLSVGLIKAILSYGVVIQTTNIIQLLNYRVSYYLINIYSGTSSLGVFSTAIAIGESVWLFSKSLANVQYPKVVNTNDPKLKIDLTIRYAKAGLIITTFLLVPLLILPHSVFEYLLGNGFTDLKWMLTLLAPGLITMGFTTMIAHYFSGTSQNKINLFASGSGLVVTFITGLILIPQTFNAGACITADLSYITVSIVLLMIFLKTEKINLKMLLPGLSDLKNISALLK